MSESLKLLQYLASSISLNISSNSSHHVQYLQSNRHPPLNRKCRNSTRFSRNTPHKSKTTYEEQLLLLSMPKVSVFHHCLVSNRSTNLDQGEIIYSKSFGSRTFDISKHEPLQTDSVLWIASLTKLVTTIACMVAVEQGLVTLDQNVREIIPEFKDLKILVGFEDGGIPRTPILKDLKDAVTLRQLLSHQSGFAYDQLSTDLQEWSKYNKRTEWTMTGSMVRLNHYLFCITNLLILLGWL